MGPKSTIIVVIGSRKASEQLLTSHTSAVISTETGTLFHKGQPAKVKMQLVSGYLQRRRFFQVLHAHTKLLEIERQVTDEIAELGANNSNVGGIVFMCDEKYLDRGGFPFRNDTRFLGLSGTSLFEKLTVVPSTSGSTLNLEHLSQQGMYILDPSEPSVVLPKALSSFTKGQGARRIDLRDIYSDAAQRVRRHGQRAVILLAGHSGHGKSKTINRLIGHQLLPVGRGIWGSTTKVIQRVEVLNKSKALSSEITVAFDDSPGLEDTTFEDRELNASLLHTYKFKHFRDIYPNVILVVAAWESITPDAHNEPVHFTSAIGKTIYALYRSNLVDDERANIVVAVTKAMSSFHQFDDYKTDKEKHTQWRIEEGRRRGIITDLQRKMFPRSSPWEIAFIENGGGSDMRAKLPVLPDGLLSHQNLYDAIHKSIKRPGSDGSLDLVGIQALQVLTGAASLDSLGDPVVLAGESKQELVKLEESTMKPLPQSPPDIIQAVASTYLGVTYDNAMGTFACTNVLEEQKFDLRPVNGRKPFKKSDCGNPLRAQPHSEELEPRRLRSHYSSDWAFRAASAVPKHPEFHILHCETVVVVGKPQLSEDMQTLIGRLPPWSLKEQPQYTHFFKNYGTHVITQLVLGGTVRTIVDSTKNDVMVFRDGGASVAAELTVHLEQNFQSLPQMESSSRWKQIRDKWIRALEKEPVFCPDHELTEYKPIYEFYGLSPKQHTDLATAYREYVASPLQNNNRRGSRNGSDSDWLQRDQNFAEAVKNLLDAVTQALYKFKQER
ncbi:hypothetical protein B0H19DRAFT_1068483 [Mycena capillaripes]|nr:hypothetical protein B0H19DRAFT_1068483 [Mycena capillaripes]